MREYLKLLKFVRPYWLKFTAACACMGVSAIFDGLTLAMMVPLADKVFNNKQIVVPSKLPAAAEQFIAALNSTEPIQLMKYMVVAIPLLFFLKGLFYFMQSYLMSDIGQMVVRDIKAKLYAKFQSLSLDFFTHKRGGELISRITNDVKLVENAVSYGSSDLVYQTLQVAVFLSITLAIYFRMALFSILLAAVIAYPIVRVGKALRKLSKRSQEKMADTNSLLHETIVGARIVKAFNAETHEISRFDRVNQEYYKLTMKSIKRTQLLQPVTELMGCVAGVGMFFFLGREVINGALSFGVFGLFLGSFLSMIRPFKKLSAVNALNQQAMAASERIHEVLETKPTVVEKPGAGELAPFSSAVVFEGVSFSYGPTEVLSGVDLTVAKGQMLAIVGPSGSGKSTLVDLVARFHDPSRGRVLIDGTDVREVTFASLRRQIGIVTQETILFNDTIRGNIAYGRREASQQEIEEAARQANIHQFIAQLPDRYDTVIGDRGAKLSGGERQRIAIARALLKNPPILILDEATSQLDTQSERLVQEALNKLIVGRTVFVVAHRLSTVRNAHKIVVLEHGRIVACGTHGELLDTCELYQNLCQVQKNG